MAIHDYVIANQNGANTRSDLNNALAAIVSNNSSATAPSTTYAFMWWADTAADILKQRNAADSAWINILTLSTGSPVGDISLGDSVKAKFGAAGDLEVYHDGSHSYIKETGTGNLYIKAANQFSVQGINNEDMILANQDGAVDLFHNNVRKLATTSNGIDVTGGAGYTAIQLNSTGGSYLNMQDSSTWTMRIMTYSTSVRWRDLVNSDYVMEISQAGNLTIDGSYSTAGVDYAEFFESTDGTAIPVGSTVTLDNGKVRVCQEGETPLGVVRPNGTSSTIGGEHLFSWKDKYLKDDYDGYLTEEANYYSWKDEDDKSGYYEDRMPEGVTPPEDATLSVQTRKLLNPDYDPTQEENYTPRSERDEWNVVGLLGQIPITKGEVTGDNWLKMKDVSDSVEMWFVK